MTFSKKHQPINIIDKVRARILLKTFFSQLTRGLIITAIALVCLSFIHVFFYPMPISLVLYIASASLTIPILFSLLFRRPPTRTICIIADRIFNSESIILTYWETIGSQGQYRDEVFGIIQRKIEKLTPTWEVTLKKQEITKFDNKAYISLLMIFFGLLLILLYSGEKTRNETVFGLNDSSSNHPPATVIPSYNQEKSPGNFNPQKYQATNIAKSEPVYDASKTSPNSIDSYELKPPLENWPDPLINATNNNNQDINPEYDIKRDGIADTAGNNIPLQQLNSNHDKPNIKADYLPININKDISMSANPSITAITQQNTTTMPQRIKAPKVRNNQNVSPYSEYNNDFSPAVRAYIGTYQILRDQHDTQ